MLASRLHHQIHSQYATLLYNDSTNRKRPPSTVADKNYRDSWRVCARADMPSVYSLPCPFMLSLSPTCRHVYLHTVPDGTFFRSSGMFGLARRFRLSDDDKSGTISFHEFQVCTMVPHLCVTTRQVSGPFSSPRVAEIVETSTFQICRPTGDCRIVLFW